MSLAAAAVETVDSKQHELDKLKNIDENAHYKCRPSDLPIYAPLHLIEKSKSNNPHPEEDSVVRKRLESGVCATRLQILRGINAVASQENNVVVLINKGKEHWNYIFDYLNEPDNSLPRIGVIAIGGLPGLILGLRGDYKRRLFYTSLGSGAIASLFYSKKVSEISESILNFATHAKNMLIPVDK